jgi:hypothetical protein
MAYDTSFLPEIMTIACRKRMLVPPENQYEQYSHLMIVEKIYQNWCSTPDKNRSTPQLGRRFVCIGKHSLHLGSRVSNPTSSILMKMNSQILGQRKMETLLYN